MIVVDANVLAAYAAGDSADIEALLVRDAVWIVPPIWLPEMRNILAKSIRAGRIELEQAMHALTRVRKRVTTADRAISSRRVLELAIETRSSAYDCEYVALAEMLYLKLVTADRALAAKFPMIAVRLDEVARGRIGDA